MGTADAGGGKLAELAGDVASRDRTAGDRVREAVAAFRAPIRVQTAGRAGVGRSTVAAALTAGTIPGVVVEETDPVDVPGAPDPVLDADVVVYVVVETVRDADRDAVRPLDPAQTFFVLNKSDTVGESRAPADAWAAATARAAECATESGLPALPLIGTLATAGDPNSGIDAVSAAVADRAARTRARRADTLLTSLRSLAARSAAARDVLEAYLADDDAVALAAVAARLHLDDCAAEAPEPPRNAEDAGRCADWWRAQQALQPTARGRRAAVDVRRHYVRVWQQLSGSRGA
ncbi:MULTISPECIES: hypothetical protein [unclassified Rhodococcus (in: high G+C Gram-positive bacteria)]|uniref:hypothetical protein n=1 Tax=unclassified Rhodococcus (in: high G+C Gram-positive bacteria) TaxID=192944 RepID=UPI00163A4CB1|nr:MULTISPECIES: hypothetical protein [unclassified Rhodococcus (in: high G+C Gram-positive bacteria)]MBC2642516.1 hypothetical protein [Rhodococcus sp. 3A]MBC2892742.1 hypothetical protein [Rhodococcus sp. 4CII]